MVSLLRELEKNPTQNKRSLISFSYYIMHNNFCDKKYVGENLQSGHGNISKPFSFGDYTEKEETGNMADFLTAAIHYHNKNNF